MPVSPDDARDLARRVLRVYTEAEATLWQRLGHRLAAGIDRDGWVAAKLAELRTLRREAEQVLRHADRAGASALANALDEAYARGAGTALDDAEAANVHDSDQPLISRALEVMLADGRNVLAATGLRVRRAVEDVYLRVTEDTAAQVVSGAVSRREAAARALARYAARGITGFTDAAGRSWDLASYTEMAARTATGQAMVQGHVERLQHAGHDLVIVSDAPEECRLCRPWEGKVLSLGRTPPGNYGGYRVAGTMRDATSDGLFHPNCRHSVSLYLPGITKAPTRTADPEGDELRRRQRAYERSIRAHKRQLTAETELLGRDDPRVQRRRAKLRARQAEFKAWREANGRKDLAYRTSTRAR